MRRTRLWRRVTVGIGLAAVSLGLLAVPAAAQQGAIVDSRHLPPGSTQFIPPKIGSGDADFSGVVSVQARASIANNYVGDNKILVRLCMSAFEPVPDHTQSSGCSPLYLLYQAPPGKCISSSTAPENVDFNYRDNDHGLDVFPGGGGLVDTWHFTGDTKGNEAGTKTGMDVFTRPFWVALGTC